MHHSSCLQSHYQFTICRKSDTFGKAVAICQAQVEWQCHSLTYIGQLNAVVMQLSSGFHHNHSFSTRFFFDKINIYLINLVWYGHIYPNAIQMFEINKMTTEGIVFEPLLLCSTSCKVNLWRVHVCTQVVFPIDLHAGLPLSTNAHEQSPKRFACEPNLLCIYASASLQQPVMGDRHIAGFDLHPAVVRSRCWLLNLESEPGLTVLCVGVGLVPSFDDKFCAHAKGLFYGIEMTGNRKALHVLSMDVNTLKMLLAKSMYKVLGTGPITQKWIKNCKMRKNRTTRKGTPQCLWAFHIFSLHPTLCLAFKIAFPSLVSFLAHHINLN